MYAILAEIKARFPINGRIVRAVAPEYIEETLLNTAHRKKIYFSEVEKGLPARMRQLALAADCPEGTMITEDIHLHSIVSRGTYFCTLSELMGGKRVPMMVTCGSKTAEGRDLVWDLLQQFSSKEFPLINEKAFAKAGAPTPPFIASCILQNKVWRPGKLFTRGLSGPISAALGWGLLYPEVCGNSHEEG